MDSEKDSNRVRTLLLELAEKYSERAVKKKSLSEMHTNNSKGIPFDLYTLKGVESEIQILGDEIKSLEATIEAERLCN